MSVDVVAGTGTERLLRFALGADAVVTGLAGAAHVLVAGPLADLLGWTRWALLTSGGGWMVYAVLLGVLATRTTINRTAVWAVIEVNLLWAVGSAVVLTMIRPDLTVAGTFWAVTVALTVTAFAALQYAGLRLREAA
ncbi:hypothetical protein [Thermostaphylospora chromogena]|uniref:SPW repeat-containing protein n=1 Tax=Thermostaphylospora chromogena TaxID=35622 RepID=A0A1H1HMP9_9ACTN|nr:hypothetical protein [Thermostaphylospora chromogena]SDR26667.1 hypothetical protein SAMN04489764_4607 [Thermostaphylospora chromogena]